MRLVLIRGAGTYELLAMCSVDGCCQLREEIGRLFEVDQRLHAEVTATLYEYVPFYGPPCGKTKALRNGIEEFRFGRLPDPGFRVLWFYGEHSQRLVCTYAFLRGQDAQILAERLLRETEAARDQYFDELESGLIHAVQLIEGTL